MSLNLVSLQELSILCIVGALACSAGDSPQGGAPPSEHGLEGAEPSVAGSEGECPAFPGGLMEPSRIEAEWEQLPLTIDYPAHVDEQGIFWFDDGGTLWAAAPGEEASPQALRLPGARTRATRLLADDTHLFWVEGAPLDSLGIRYTEPPFRLYALPKTGGPPVLLLEEQETGVELVDVSADHVLVLSDTWPEAYLWVAKDGSGEIALPLDSDAYSLQVSGDSLYFIRDGEYSSEPDNAYQELFRAKLDGSELERLASTEGWDLQVSEGRAFWKRQLITESRTTEERFMMLSESTGCVQELPHDGGLIGQHRMDGHHLYWHAFREPDAASSDASRSRSFLLRVDLDRGLFESIRTPGYPEVATFDLIGQTSSKLYVRGTTGDRELFAIVKP